MRLCPFDGGPVTPEPIVEDEDLEGHDGVVACHVCWRRWWLDE